MGAVFCALHLRRRWLVTPVCWHLQAASFSFSRSISASRLRISRMNIFAETWVSFGMHRIYTVRAHGVKSILFYFVSLCFALARVRSCCMLPYVATYPFLWRDDGNRDRNCVGRH